LAFRLFSDVSDATAPVISVPALVTVDATGPTGAAVSYSASATDDVDGSVVVSCSPATGSTFPIGQTSVTCEANDAAGNLAQAGFSVHVKGVAEQLDGLAAAVVGVGPGDSLADKAADVQAALGEGDLAKACESLRALVNQVRAQSGKSLTSDQTAALIAAADRIRAVLSC
jgi:hypothetical protein